jgi:uncharacterized protein
VKPVFADTFYFIALLNPSDAAHEPASSFGRGKRQRPPILTTGFVLTEVADALCHQSQRELFINLLKVLRARRFFTIVPPSEGLFDAGVELYSRRPDKDWSLTDCISFHVMRDQGISEALTADKHFEQAGFVALLK